jgi:transposase
MNGGPPDADKLALGNAVRRWAARMQYVGSDSAYRRAASCAKQADGTISGERFVPADEDGLARLVIELGSEVRACLEMMGGAIWVRDRRAGAGWQVELAAARKVKHVAPLACKTDEVAARVLAERRRRELVPALWIPSLEERALRERLKRRLQLVRLRTAAKNRGFGLLSQWGSGSRPIVCADPTRSSCSRHALCPSSGAAPWPRRSR